MDTLLYQGVPLVPLLTRLLGIFVLLCLHSKIKDSKINAYFTVVENTHRDCLISVSILNEINEANTSSQRMPSHSHQNEKNKCCIQSIYMSSKHIGYTHAIANTIVYLQICSCLQLSVVVCCTRQTTPYIFQFRNQASCQSREFTAGLK